MVIGAKKYKKMDIRNLFKIVCYGWYLVTFLQIFVVFSYGKKKSDISNQKKKRFESFSKDFQPYFFITVYNAIIITIFVITKIESFLLIGILFGGLVYFSSLVGDTSDVILPINASKSLSVESVTLRNLICIPALCMLISFGSNSQYIKSIKECTEFYALIEVFFLCFFMYFLFYYIGISINLVLGYINWISVVNYDQRIKELRLENEQLKEDIDKYSDIFDGRYSKFSLLLRIFLFLPICLNVTIYFTFNYFRQMIRNIKLVCCSILGRWCNMRKENIQQDKFLNLVRRIKHISIIMTLCVIYIWLNFEVGNSTLTRIVYGFSTIIIIPIAINRIS